MEHWSLTQAGTLADAQVELFWEDASASGINDCSTLVVAHWDGTFWQGSVSTTSGSCAGNDAGTARSVPALSDFGIFTFGFSDGTIGITESVAGPLLQAHPVPSSDRVSIIGLPLRAVIRVVDETSRTIPAFLNENRLDVSDRPSGLYTMLSEDRAVRFIVAHLSAFRTSDRSACGQLVVHPDSLYP